MPARAQSSTVRPRSAPPPSSQRTTSTMTPRPALSGLAMAAHRVVLPLLVVVPWVLLALLAPLVLQAPPAPPPLFQAPQAPLVRLAPLDRVVPQVLQVQRELRPLSQSAPSPPVPRLSPTPALRLLPSSTSRSRQVQLAQQDLLAAQALPVQPARLAAQEALARQAPPAPLVLPARQAALIAPSTARPAPPTPSFSATTRR